MLLIYLCLYLHTLVLAGQMKATAPQSPLQAPPSQIRLTVKHMMSLSKLIKGKAKGNHSAGKSGPCRLMTLAMLSLRCLKYRVLNELCDRSFKADVWWCHAVAAQWGLRANEHISQRALIVSSLTQCLVQLCHFWMVPACSLGLMAGRRQKNETKTWEGVKSEQSGGIFYRPNLSTKEMQKCYQQARLVKLVDGKKGRSKG